MRFHLPTLAPILSWLITTNGATLINLVENKGTLLILALWLPAVHLYPMYGERIPNGDQVPHPCKPNFLWHGVGHRISQGGGARNPFGEDFAANGHKWTEALCGKDSDGDGRTNGEELGDPDCVWTKGKIPPSTSGITHPGVCDPWNATKCISRNVWLDCSRDEVFNCPAINDLEVLNVTLRFPRTKVPAKETTYICFNFELPDDREYHLIAIQPYIDNHNVMHHIGVSACHSSVKLVDKPYECQMAVEGCSQVLGGWALGQTGQCVHPKAGYLIGKGHKSMVVMQLHWTNPGLVDEWFDSSGLTLYFTPKLRQYNAGFFTLGQTYLSIPPGQTSWTHSGTCTSRCSRRLLHGDIQVFSTLSHMHYLGIRQNVTLTRPGGPVEVMAEDNPFRYGSPVLHLHDPPITIHPGDELTTHCTYQSRSRPKTTVFGKGSHDEMCIAYLNFFTAENADSVFCIQRKHKNHCELRKKCDLRTFNTSHPATAAIVKKVLDNCGDPVGSPCPLKCRTALDEATAENSCVSNMWDYVNTTAVQDDPALLQLVAAMESCARRHGDGHGDGDGDGDGDGEDHPELVTPRPSRPAIV